MTSQNNNTADNIIDLGCNYAPEICAQLGLNQNQEQEQNNGATNNSNQPINWVKWISIAVIALIVIWLIVKMAR